MLTCTSCARDGIETPAEFFVWVEDWPIYHYLCHVHLIDALENGLPKTQIGDPVGKGIARVCEVQRIETVMQRKMPDQIVNDLKRALARYGDHHNWNQDSRIPHTWLWEGSTGAPWQIAEDALRGEGS